MKIYVELPHIDISKGVGRVKDALVRHAPAGVEIVKERRDADLVVHHVVGVQNYDTMPIDARIADDHKPYAMIQYVWQTTENGGDPAFWGPLHDGAAVVWSYYRIPTDNLYHAPLGVDEVFIDSYQQNRAVPKIFDIGTSGWLPTTEGAVEASRAIGGDFYQFHLGPDFRFGPRVCSQVGLSDEQVARRWAECRYVSGLRRGEGFELPAAEALVCGTRPILFNKPHYRDWYGEYATYIEEGDSASVTTQIRQVLHEQKPVQFDEILWARQQFDWKRLVTEFFRRLQ